MAPRRGAGHAHREHGQPSGQRARTHIRSALRARIASLGGKTEKSHVEARRQRGISEVHSHVEARRRRGTSVPYHIGQGVSVPYHIGQGVLSLSSKKLGAGTSGASLAKCRLAHHFESGISQRFCLVLGCVVLVRIHRCRYSTAAPSYAHALSGGMRSPSCVPLFAAAS